MAATHRIVFIQTSSCLEIKPSQRDRRAFENIILPRRGDGEVLLDRRALAALNHPVFVIQGPPSCVAPIVTFRFHDAFGDGQGGKLSIGTADKEVLKGKELEGPIRKFKFMSKVDPIPMNVQHMQ